MQEENLDDVLIRHMPPGLKEAIDRLLARGASKAGIMSAIRAMVARAATKPGQGGLTIAQCEAYLETK